MPKSNLEKSKKFRQALKKVIATGLSVLALTPMTKSFVPSTLKAFNEVGENKNKKDNENEKDDENNSNIEQNNQVSETEVKKEDKNYGSSLKNKFKNLSAKKKILAFGASAVVALGSIACLAKKFNSGEKKDDSPNESNIPSIQKIALIGNSESGKTTFIKRIFNGVFNREYGPTISGELISIEQTFNNQKIKFNFRDTSGIKLYHEDADLVLIFVDLSKNIDQQLTTWFGIFKEATNSKTKAMVILSRSELASKDQNIESIKYHINQSIEDDLELSGRVTLFKNPISSQSISDEEILEFENEMYRVIMPA